MDRLIPESPVLVLMDLRALGRCPLLTPNDEQFTESHTVVGQESMTMKGLGLVY